MRVTIALALMLVAVNGSYGRGRSRAKGAWAPSHGREAAPSHADSHESLNWGAPYVPCPPDDTPVTAEQQAVIQPMLLDRRVHVTHSLWHDFESGNPTDLPLVTSQFGSGWDSKATLCPLPTSDDKGNPMGENFLYFHRRMRSAWQSALNQAGLKCIGGWTHIPDISDKNYPVITSPPPNSGDGAKSADALTFIQEWFRITHNRYWLKAHSLSELGIFIENTWHNYSHMRFADDSQAVDSNFPITTRFITDLDFPAGWKDKQDKSTYLGDPWSSAANMIFMKLHGAVDDTIDLWAKAHGVTLSLSCAGQPPDKCYQWRGTWAGGNFDVADKRLAVKIGSLPEAESRYGDSAAIPRFKERGFFLPFKDSLRSHLESLPKSLKAGAKEGGNPDPDLAEYEANKARWDQMETELRQRLCPPAGQ